MARFIPLDLLPLALAYLRADDVASTRQVCVAWRSLRAAWPKMDLGTPHFAKRMDICIPNAVRAVSNYAPVLDTHFAVVEHFPNLREIDVYKAQVTDDCLLNLGANTHLETLKLCRCTKLTGANFGCLPATLTLLDLSSCNITDKALAQLVHLTNLTSLDLSTVMLTDVGLCALSSINLVNLSLEYCRYVTDAGLLLLGRNKSLKRLTLSSGSVTDAGLAHLTSLTSLTLSSCSKITGHAFSSLPNLLVLYTWFCESIAVVRSDTLLELSLNGTGVSCIQFSCSELDALRVSLCGHVDNAWLAQVGACTKLTSLSLTNCDKVDDKGMAVLRSLSCLESLEVCTCRWVSRECAQRICKDVKYY